MLTGYNTDFKFKGKIYHVQTEDGGANSPNIISLLYHQGEILFSRKTSYEDILKADCLDEVVRELMIEQHKTVIRDLMHGNIALPKEHSHHHAAAKHAPAHETKSHGKTAAPKPKEAVKEKSLDDVILEFLAQEQKDRSGK